MSEALPDHPTADDLRALSLGQLGEADLARLSAHLGECPGCCRLIDQLAATDPLLARLQHRSAHPEEPLVTPAQRRSAVRALRRMTFLSRPDARGETARTSHPTQIPAPSQVGEYEILAEVGRGGMGVVYKARHRGLHRLAALKMVLAGELASPAQERRFRLEAELAARVQHPNIVQIYEVGSYQGHPFLAMEWVEGGSLGDRLDGKPWRSGEAAALVETLARAVHVAHREGVIHRDLKPTNILLQTGGSGGKTDQGESSQPVFTAEPTSGLLPKITDFGLARPIEGGVSLTQSGLLVGTPGYMAPEQAAGSGRRAVVGPATDIYGLGVILYQLLTGQLPFQGDSTLEVLRAVTSDEPVRPRHLQPQLPRDLEAITLNCLEKEPTHRYPSTLALAEDLQRFRAGKPVTARPVGSGARLVRACRRRPLVALLLGLLTASLVGGLAGVTWMWRKAERNLQEAEVAQGQTKDEATRALAAEREMRRQWYAASSNLMQPAWDTGQIGRLRTLLLETEAYPDRGFEWYYWQRLCHLDLLTFIGHRSDVNSVSWSPDGARLATGSTDATAKVWDVAREKELLTFRGHKGVITSVAWSPDGARLATGSTDATAKVWDVAREKELHTLRGHKAEVTSVAWSPDGARLVTASYDGTAKVWDAADGRELLTFAGHAGQVLSVCWSPDSARLATGSGDGTARVWDATGGRDIITLRGHTGRVTCVTWSSDGTRLATGSVDGTAKVWDAAGGQAMLTIAGHASEVRSVSWSRDGKRLATGSLDGTAKVWDAASGLVRLTLAGHAGEVRSVSWSPHGARLATASVDRTARVWDAVGGQARLTLAGHAGEVRSVSWSRDEKRLATGSVDGTAKVWDAVGGHELLTLKGHTGPVYAASWSPDGARLVTGSTDATAKVWDAAGGGEPLTLTGHTGPVYTASWSLDGARLATGSGDGTARVWDAAGGPALFTLKGHTGTVYTASWSPDGERLVTGSYDGTAKVWDAAGGGEPLTLAGHTGPVYTASWSPDGARLATGSGDGTTKVWDATGGRDIITLRGHTGRVTCVTWSSDGTRLATGSVDGTAKVWDAAGGHELLTFKGHAGWVYSVSWSPDGSRLATGSKDGMVKVWDAADAAAVQQWARQDRALQDLLDSNDFRSPRAQGFLQTWLLLLPLPFAAGESGAQALDRQQLPDESQLRPRPEEVVTIGGRRWAWQEYRSPRAVVNYNAVAGQVAERSVAYAVCYIECDRAREGLWLQVGTDDQGKVYLNGRSIYEYRQSRDVSWLNVVGPLGLERGVNVLLFKVANESGQWEGCMRLVDDAGRPVQGLRVELTP